MSQNYIYRAHLSPAGTTFIYERIGNAIQVVGWRFAGGEWWRFPRPRQEHLLYITEVDFPTEKTTMRSVMDLREGDIEAELDKILVRLLN